VIIIKFITNKITTPNAFPTQKRHSSSSSLQTKHKTPKLAFSSNFGEAIKALSVKTGS
jgi:hypothetical protein